MFIEFTINVYEIFLLIDKQSSSVLGKCIALPKSKKRHNAIFYTVFFVIFRSFHFPIDGNSPPIVLR